MPDDPNKPSITSGLRIGTPAVTTRGFGIAECKQLTHWICDILDNLADASLRARIRGEVVELCRRFPVYT